jgi:DNA-binding transcriptional regulator YiaG
MPPKPMTMEEYIITRNGEIINSRNNYVLKPQPNNKGYLRVTLCGKKYFVHKLVAEKYIPNPDNKEQINHKDGNKNNNSVENLEWVTNQENRNHAINTKLHLQGEDCPWSKLTQNQVNNIREDSTHSNKELSELYGVSISTINDIINGRTWKN